MPSRETLAACNAVDITNTLHTDSFEQSHSLLAMVGRVLLVGGKTGVA